MNEAALRRRHQYDHAAATIGRKLTIVEIVAIECDQRAPKLSSEAIVFAVGRAAQVRVFENEHHIPRKRRPHVRHESGRDIRVNVNSRLSGQLLGVAAELGRQRAH
jgi:hypothetical protein